MAILTLQARRRGGPLLTILYSPAALNLPGHYLYLMDPGSSHHTSIIPLPGSPPPSWTPFRLYLPPSRCWTTVYLNP